MKAIQIVVDEAMLTLLDRFAHKQRVSRSALIRKSLETVLEQERIRELVEADRRAFAKTPPNAVERATYRALSNSQRRVLDELGDEDSW